MKKNHFLVYLLIKIAVIGIFAGLLILNVFEKLDYRLYDSFLHLRDEPELNENVMLVKIDDKSINLLEKEWPWTRDVIADALLRLRECGADAAVFDIEYISPSSNGIAPSAEQKISDNILATQDNVVSLIGQLSDAASSGFYAPEEIPELASMMINDNITYSFDELTNFVANNISRDNDEYFAECLQFFGRSYLTINHMDMGYPVTDEELEYIENRFLFDTVKDNENLVRMGNERTAGEAREQLGMTPALHKLITRAYNVSFTNSVVDSDGVRRRMELLFNYNGKYLPQLAFGPYLDIVKSRNITREKNHIIVHGATDPVTGAIRDIKIPVDPYGRLLINWRHGSCDESFETESIIEILNLDRGESNIITCLNNIFAQAVMGEDGFAMEYTDAAGQLLGIYDQISGEKDYLLSKCAGYDENNQIISGISDEEYENYYNLRTDFYAYLGEFLKAGYLDGVIERLNQILTATTETEDGEIIGIDADTAAIINDMLTYLPEDFDILQQEYDRYVSELDRLKTKFDGSYCIIGNTATSTTDNGATPFEEKFMNVGIHANILNTLLTENFITSYRWYWGFIAAAIIALLMLLTSNTSNAFQNISAAVAYTLYCLFFVLFFVKFDSYVPVIGSYLYLVTDLLAGIALRFYYSTAEKKFITQIAASFANKDTVDELRRNPDAFKTEGQKKVITALFSDIQKFSTLSESIGKIYGAEGPNKLIEILNAYLGDMSNEILKNNGTIDKYEGDAIISMFGAPDPLGSHTPEEWAYLCLDSAIKMKAVEVEFNKTHSDLFVPKEVERNGMTEIVTLKPLQTRIGVNTGDAFVGLMGSKTDAFSKLNYTMIGDTVNLASRLEGVNKAYASWIMCSEDTWKRANSGANEGKIIARHFDSVRVVGRSTPVPLYNILGFKEDITAEQIDQIGIFHEGIDHYLKAEFEAAIKCFEKANSMAGGDPSSVLFVDRCKNFITNGVPEGWDGVRTMDSK